MVAVPSPALRLCRENNTSSGIFYMAGNYGASYRYRIFVIQFCFFILYYAKNIQTKMTELNVLNSNNLYSLSVISSRAMDLGSSKDRE